MNRRATILTVALLFTAWAWFAQPASLSANPRARGCGVVDAAGYAVLPCPILVLGHPGRLTVSLYRRPAEGIHN